MESRKYKVIFFDFGGTLDYDGLNWEERAAKFAQMMGLKNDPETLYEAGHSAIHSMYRDPMLITQSFPDTLSQFTAGMLDHLKCSDGKIHSEISRALYTESKDFLNRNLNLLKTLKSEYRMGVISNNFGNTAGWCNECGFGEVFHTIIDSTLVGSRKPEPQIFKIALERINASPEEALHVGDRYNADVTGAKGVGMSTVLIKPKGLEPSQDPQMVDYHIKSLLELKDIL